jgi:hypothetical protein
MPAARRSNHRLLSGLSGARLRRTAERIDRLISAWSTEPRWDVFIVSLPQAAMGLLVVYARSTLIFLVVPARWPANPQAPVSAFNQRVVNLAFKCGIVNNYARPVGRSCP